MADIRFNNTFSLAGGFNITNAEPIDSRMYVADIAHIYLADNWVKVKPYPGLIVADPTGEVRVCVNSDYTLESSWKKIGGGAVTVTTYSEAVALATDDNIGQVIYVSSESTYEEVKYGAAPYIITGNGTLLKLAASSAGDDVTSDIAALQTRMSAAEGQLTSIDAELDTKATTAYVDTEIADLEVVLGNTYVTSTTASETYLSKTDAASTYVDKTTYDSKVSNIETTASGIRTDLDALASTVGKAAEGDSASTGIFKEIDALKADVTAIPKFDILPVDELPTENISDSTVYLVKDKDSEGDLYTEYIYVNGAWENLGKQTVDLSNYYTKGEADSAITTAITTSLAAYYTKAEVDAELLKKADLSVLNNYVQTSVLADYAKTADVNSALDLKADESALADYAKTADVNSALDLKADESALSNYVLKSDHETSVSDLTALINKKADSTALGNYLKIADIDANLTAYVKQDSLTTQLNDYVKSTDLSTTLADYVNVSAMNGSSSISLVENVYEVNTITTAELNSIINGTVVE